MKLLPLLALATLSTGAARPQQEIPHCHMIGPFVLFFAKGSTALDQRSREVLDYTRGIVTKDMCFDDAVILIAGHTNAGELDSLALKRAKVTRDALISRGVAADRITVEAYGARVPRTYGKSRDENRRAEISFDFRY